MSYITRALRRPVLVVGVLLAAGCGSASNTPDARSTAATAPLVQQRGLEYDFRVEAEGRVAVAEFSQPAGAVWNALQGAYRELGIELGTFDVPRRTLGNRQLQVGSRLGETPVTRIVSCRRTGTALSGASAYRVRLTILSSLQPAEGGGTLLETVIQGVGTPMEGGSRSPTECPSTGQLERAIAEATMRHLAFMAP